MRLEKNGNNFDGDNSNTNGDNNNNVDRQWLSFCVPRPRKPQDFLSIF